MNKHTLFGIFYVSAWIIVWGSIGSLIDYPLLQGNVYLAGSTGQACTFTLTGFLSVMAAILIFPKINKKLNNDQID